MTDYALKLSEEEIARYRMMAEAARARESDVWEIAGFGLGVRVADVGCGPGAMLPALSEVVGSTGAVEAIDASEDAVAAATALVEAAGLANVSVRQGRAEETGLEPGAFDVVMMRHVLAHNGSAAQEIVRHLASLARPGGTVFLVDVDMTALRNRPTTGTFTEMMERYAEFQVARGGAIQVGLHLDELLERAGLEVESYGGLTDVVRLGPGMRGPAWAAREAMVAAGVASEADVARWGAELDQLEADGTPVTAFVPRFLAVGRKKA